MSLDKLSRLIGAFGTATPTTKRKKPVEEEAQEQAVSSATPSQEAVQISAGFGSYAAQNNSEAAAKVARIKEQVQNGTYKVDSTKVAESLIRDLFV